MIKTNDFKIIYYGSCLDPISERGYFRRYMVVERGITDIYVRYEWQPSNNKELQQVTLSGKKYNIYTEYSKDCILERR